MSTRRWSDLSDPQRAAIMALGSFELALTATALVDLARRPPGTVRFGRRPWWFLVFVQPLGPIVYLFWARRPVAGRESAAS